MPPFIVQIGHHATQEAFVLAHAAVFAISSVFSSGWVPVVTAERPSFSSDSRRYRQ
jgi:hypothetical protein